MRTKIFLALVCPVAVAACGGGDPSAADVCSEAAASTCRLLYRCESPAQLAAAGYPATEDACVGYVAGQLACASASWQSVCPSDETADPMRFDACAGAIGYASCDDTGSSDFGLAACDDLCSGGGTSPNPDGGTSSDTTTLSVTWTIEGVNDCALVGATYVVVDSYPLDGTAPYEDLFDCGDYGGLVADLPPDTYNVTVTAFDAADVEQAGGYSGVVDATGGGTYSVTVDLEP